MTRGGGVQSWTTKKSRTIAQNDLHRRPVLLARNNFREMSKKRFFLSSQFLHWNNRPPGTQLEILHDFDAYIVFFYVFYKQLNKWNLENRILHEKSPPKVLIPDLYDPWWRGAKLKN